MYKILSLLIIAVLTTGYQTAAQAPGIKWQKTLGGSSADDAGNSDTASVKRPKVAVIDYRDNKYIVGGNTSSNDGDISGNHGGQDIWIAKLDTQRNVVWSSCLGGTNNESLASVQLAKDSGYIVSGTTSSTNGNVSGNHGGFDIWVTRLGSTGNIVWQKCYGGTGYDEGGYIEKTADGYILTGTTTSTDGDITGLHGTGNKDIWVAKLDNNGVIQWQKCLGGTDDDDGVKIKQTADSGYIVLGTTRSSDGDVAGIHSTFTQDIWLVKLDKNGTIEWQKCLGGTGEEAAGDIQFTSTGYIIAGLAWSNNGDVTGNHGQADGWVASLTSSGSILWQRSLGGTVQDGFSSILSLPNKTYVVSGFTGSANGDVSFTHGGYDSWLVNLSSTGSIVWEKTYGGSSWDAGGVVTLNQAGKLVVLGSTGSNDLDVSGNHGATDIWLFEAAVATNTVTGYVYFDVNLNGVRDNGESFFDQCTIHAQKNGAVRSSVPYNGVYKIEIDTGTFGVGIQPYFNNSTIMPPFVIINHTTWFNTDSVHFALQPYSQVLDADISLVPVIATRVGAPANYVIDYKNIGNKAIVTGKIKLVKDHRMSFTSATPSPAYVSADTISWNISNLNANTGSSISVHLQTGFNPAVNLGDTLKSVTWIEPDGVDIKPKDDTMTLKQIVIDSYDPNDKTEANAGIITPAQVSNREYLNYVIRFQNTGTDTAYNITVRDTLDRNTLQMISASHPYQLTIDDISSKYTWQFNNIKLPSKDIDEANSHGYIAYRVWPKPTVQVGDTIKNTAGIYFDLNLPVATNTDKTLVMVLSPLPVTLTSFQATLDGSVVNVTWKTSIEENVKHFDVQRSSNGVDFTTIGIVQPAQTAYLFKDKEPLSGYNYYRLKSVDVDGKNSLSTIVLVNVKNEADVISSLYPNPGNGNITLKLQGAVKGNVLVQVLDQQGRQIITKQFGVQHTGEFKTPLVLGGLPKGSYVLRIMIDDKVYLHKLLIQ